jgi:transposase
VISAVTVSPQRRRFGLYYRLHPTNIGQAEVCEFLRHLLRHLRGPVIVLLDNSRTHKGEPLRVLCRRYPRLRLAYFPSYAPELNPDEGVWSLAKRQLANGRPDTLPDLRWDVEDVLYDIGRSQRLLRACVTQSDLPPFLP